MDGKFPSVRKFFAIRYNQIWWVDESNNLAAMDPQKIQNNQPIRPVQDNDSTVNIAFNSVKRALFVLNKNGILDIYDGLRRKTTTLRGEDGSPIIRAQWSTHSANHLFILDSEQNLSIYDIKKKIYLFEPIPHVQVFYVFPQQVENYYFVAIQNNFVNFYDSECRPIIQDSIQTPKENTEYDIVSDHEYIYLANSGGYIYVFPINHITSGYTFTDQNCKGQFGKLIGFYENEALFGGFSNNTSFLMMKNGEYHFFDKQHKYAFRPKDQPNKSEHITVKCASFNPSFFVTKTNYALYFCKNEMYIINPKGEVEKTETREMSDFFISSVEEICMERVERLLFRRNQLQRKQDEYDAKKQSLIKTFSEFKQRSEELKDLKQKYEDLYNQVQHLQPYPDDYSQLKRTIETILSNYNELTKDNTS